VKIELGIARPGRTGDYLFVRTRFVDRPYPGVPREGDVVDIDDEGTHGASVESVSWENDGTISLELGELPELSDSTLDEWGFSVEPADEDEEAAAEEDEEDPYALSTIFTATPPRELENLQSAIDYLSPTTVGELVDELAKYDRTLRVEISSDDDDLDGDMIYDRYESGRSGEGTEFVDLQAACLRAVDIRPVAPPRSNCILCGGGIELVSFVSRSHWAHVATGHRECSEGTHTA
jgi:hypothetical protein